MRFLFYVVGSTDGTSVRTGWIFINSLRYSPMVLLCQPENESVNKYGRHMPSLIYYFRKIEEFVETLHVNSFQCLDVSY